MNLFNFMAEPVSKVVNSVGSVIDKIFTSDEERLNAKNELEKIKNQALLEVQQKAYEYEKEISKRWTSDNEHFITRLVRPSIVIWVYALFSIVILSDGNVGSFHINSAYIPMLETIITTVTVAYFGSRGIEKVSKFVKKDK